MSASQAVNAVRIGGHGLEPLQPVEIDLTDPVTGKSLPPLLGGGAADFRAAVDAAVLAYDDWRTRPTATRVAVLRDIADRLEEHGKRLSQHTTAETGKRLVEAEAEVAFSCRYFRWYADVIATDIGDDVRANANLSQLTSKRSLGVVAVVTPWNFPLSIPARKLAPLLAAGCAAVFKPSEVAPRTSLLFAEVLDGALPPGLVNTVVSRPQALGSSEMLADDRVRGLTFTGSTRVGRIFAQEAAARFQRSVLELGGNAPFIVMEDADPVAAEACLRVAKYRNNGQSCIAANQVWVHESVADEFSELVEKAARELRIGDPRSPETDLGPLALASDPSRLEDFVSRAEMDGARVMATRLEPRLSDGNYFAPRVCSWEASESQSWDEEVFGPITQIRTFSDIRAVVSAINASSAGLASYICTRDRYRGIAIGKSLETGVVGINTATPNDPSLPFGGFKSSGWGREGGRAGLAMFYEDQLIGVADHP